MGAPYLYRKDDPAELLLGPLGSDVPRNHESVALIGDPRNDVHLFSSQMTVAFIKLHNRLVERLRREGVTEDAVFAEARRLATWHYQHVILREFLPGLVGASLTAELLDEGPELYSAERGAYIPLEFADAAYRYGHAQIRDRYQVNEPFGPVPVFPDLMGLARSRPSPWSTGPFRSTSQATRPRSGPSGSIPAPISADRSAAPGLRVSARHRLCVACHP